MNLTMVHCDVLCDIVHHLPIQSAHNLLCANKQLFNDRKTLMASNKALQAFAKRYEMPYFNMLFNSHIKTVDVYLPELKSHYGHATSMQIYNTQRMLSYMMDHTNDVSRINCNNRLKYYLSTLLMTRYTNMSSSKTLNAYMDTLNELKWWNSNINLYELFEAICLTKSRKYREVQQILAAITLGKIGGLNSLLETLSILLNMYMKQMDMNIKAVIVYVMHAYIDDSMQYMKEAKRCTIDFLIDLNSMYIDVVTSNTKIRLPKYLKTMIYDKLKHVEGPLHSI